MKTNKKYEREKKYWYPQKYQLINIIWISIMCILFLYIIDLYVYNSTVKYEQLPKDTVVVDNQGYTCEYRQLVTGQNNCDLDQNISINNLKALASTSTQELEHLYIIDEKRIEDAYIQINNDEYPKLSAPEYIRNIPALDNSYLCSNSHITSGNIINGDNQFTTSVNYMMETYGEYQIGSTYDEGTLVGISNNDVICTSSKASNSEFIDLSTQEGTDRLLAISDSLPNDYIPSEYIIKSQNPNALATGIMLNYSGANAYTRSFAIKAYINKNYVVILYSIISSLLLTLAFLKLMHLFPLIDRKFDYSKVDFIDHQTIIKKSKLSFAFMAVIIISLIALMYNFYVTTEAYIIFILVMIQIFAYNSVRLYRFVKLHRHQQIYAFSLK